MSVKRSNKSFVSGQLVVALAVLIGFSAVAQAKAKTPTFKPTFKVEKCDCLGFSEDIPTFLSDLLGADGVDVYGEGQSISAAEKAAKLMCVETYRNFASVNNNEHPASVTHTGCQKMQSTADGDWKNI